MTGSHIIPELIPDWYTAELTSDCKDLSFDTKLGWFRKREEDSETGVKGQKPTDTLSNENNVCTTGSI